MTNYNNGPAPMDIDEPEQAQAEPEAQAQAEPAQQQVQPNPAVGQPRHNRADLRGVRRRLNFNDIVVDNGQIRPGLVARAVVLQGAINLQR